MLRFSELVTAYKLVWKRRRLLYRALRKRHQLASVQDRTNKIAHDDVLVFATIRNEANRLPYFLDHYRSLGVGHFLFVENDSDDGSKELLSAQPDVSLWTTSHSYKLSRFGLDWLTWLQIRHAHGHWCLTLDADEILVYPHYETRPLPALTEWLDVQGRLAFPAMMLDMYPKSGLGDGVSLPGEDPIEHLGWFDSGNYMIQRQVPNENLWIQGGVRARAFFGDDPRRAPTMNKVPLVKWRRSYTYLNSTHAALPRKLNRTYATDGGEDVSGILLHTKFLPEVVKKSAEEKQRRQHFQNSELYETYYEHLIENPILWNEQSQKFSGWRQLEALGLMSRGGWQ